VVQSLIPCRHHTHPNPNPGCSAPIVVDHQERGVMKEIDKGLDLDLDLDLDPSVRLRCRSTYQSISLQYL